jgi:hypothetical protein
LDLSKNVQHRTETDAADTTSRPINTALQEGFRSYCLERARDEELRTQQLTAKWQPLYTEWKKNALVGPLLVDPGFDTVASLSTRRTASRKATDTQTLLMEVTEGLAMATIECEVKPGYVSSTLIFCCCLIAVQLAVVPPHHHKSTPLPSSTSSLPSSVSSWLQLHHL